MPLSWQNAIVFTPLFIKLYCCSLLAILEIARGESFAHWFPSYGRGWFCVPCPSLCPLPAWPHVTSVTNGLTRMAEFCTFKKSRSISYHSFSEVSFPRHTQHSPSQAPKPVLDPVVSMQPFDNHIHFRAHPRVWHLSQKMFIHLSSLLSHQTVSIPEFIFLLKLQIDAFESIWQSSVLQGINWYPGEGFQ